MSAVARRAKHGKQRQALPATIFEGAVALGAALGLLIATTHAPHHAVAAAGCPHGVNIGTCFGKATTNAVVPYLKDAIAGGIVGAVAGLAVLLMWSRLAPQRPVVAPRRRQSIPERVRREVWRRDRGQCVDCGSRERLEFDHIIPVSKGGSNTVRNIELRCEICNRAKGGRI